MEYRLLGRLEVLDRGEPIDIGPRQQRALLALLLVNANRVVSTERILEALWGDDAHGKERTLWVYISRLRTALEPDREAHAKSEVIVTRDHGYCLVADPSDVDLIRFEEIVERAGTLVKDNPELASAELAEALGMWRGEALEDFAYEEFAQATIARLDELRLVALEDRIDADMRLGRHREVLGELAELVRGYPLRERPVGLSMVALYRSGRQADALRAFGDYRARIGEELGIEPSPELRRIEEQVLLHDSRLDPPGHTGAAPTPADVQNPFKGLQAFTEADAATFFGRDRLIGDLVRRLAGGTGLLALVGASGSGKSSVVRAGLIPALRKGAIPGSDRWVTALMVPGSRPFVELEAALLRSTLDGPDRLPELSGGDEDGLLRAALRLLPDGDGRLLLVIDQFEELFTLVGSEEERSRFIRNIETALDDPHERVCVVVALRADFYARVLDYPGLAGPLGEGIVNTVHLTPDELEAAAEEPAAVAGVRLEPALLARLLADVAGQSGGLPLFQYALTELFDRRSGGLLTAAAYDDMGGVQGALSRTAEDVYGELTDDEKAAAKQLFLRLVTIPETGAWSRRRVTGAQITTIAADVVALQTVLDRFGARRLLTFDRDLVTGSPTVEVAHEALLHEWPRLRDWIEQGRDDVLRHARFTVALDEWIASGSKADYLLTGDRLADYEYWATVSSLRLSDDERRFLEASIGHREAVVQAEAERSERETLLDRQARTRLRGLVAAAVVLAVIAGGIAWAALSGRPPEIAVVTAAQGDLGVNDLVAAGRGMAERVHEVPIDEVESLIDPVADLRNLAASGADLIVASGELDVAVETVAQQFPDVTFVAIDPAAVHIERDNLSEIHFAVEESGFLAGAAAAMTTETNVVGFIGSMQIFHAEQSRNGFEQGVAARRDNVEVRSAYIGPVENPRALAPLRDDLVYEMAGEMYRGGADIIFHDAGEAGAGVVRAARELSPELGRHLWAIGSDVDEYHAARSDVDRSHILSSTIKHYDTAVVAAVDAFLGGTLEPGESILHLSDDGVGLSRRGDHLAAVDGQLKNLEGEMSMGHATVYSHSVTAPAWQREPDVIVALTLRDRSCDAEVVRGPALDGDHLRVPRGDVVRFDVVSEMDRVSGISLRTVPSTVTLDDLYREAEFGIPESYDAMLSISLIEPGGSTSSAALMAGEAFVPNCFFHAGFGAIVANDDFPPFIVSPAS